MTTLSQHGDGMVYFKEIRPTDHYLQEHEQDVPWNRVVEIIMATKNPRKKGGKFEIETNDEYVLFERRENIIYVINAKKC